MPGAQRQRRGRHATRALAVWCGQKQLVLAEAAAGPAGPRLTVLECEPIPADLLAARATPAACCDALLPGLVARRGLRGRRAVVVVESHAACRFWAAPALHETDRLGCLAFEAEKWCQTPATDLWLGSLPRDLPPDHGAPGVRPGREEEDALGVAAPASAVVPLLRSVAAAGLEPWGVSVPPLALEGLLGSRAPRPASAATAAGASPGTEAEAGEIEIALHFGAERSWLAVCRRGRLLMLRDLDLARDGMVAALSQVSVEGQGNVRLSADDAAALLDRFGTVMEDEPFGMATDRIPLESLKYALRPALERLTGAINRSLDFCREQHFIEIPETIALTGAGTGIPAIDVFLSAHLMARVRPGVSWQGRLTVADAEAAVWDAQSGDAAIAAGAAVGALSGRVVPSRSAAFGLGRWIALPVKRLLAGAMAVLALGALLLGARVDRLSARHAADEARIADLRARLSTAQARYRTLEESVLEHRLVEAFARENIRSDGILKVLSQAVGSEVSLTELDLPSLNAGLLQQGGAPAAAETPPAGLAPPPPSGAGATESEPGVMTLRGRVRTDRDRLESCVARLMMRLESAPYFESVTFVGSAEEGEHASSFHLRCKLRQGLRSEPRAPEVARR